MAKLAKGTKIGVSISSTYVNFTEVNGTISAVSPTVTEIETTTHDTVGGRTYIPGLVDYGSLSLDIYYNDADLNSAATALGYCLGEMAAGKTDTFKLLYIDGVTQTFTGFMKSFTPSLPQDGLQTGKIEIKISGTPTTTPAA